MEGKQIEYKKELLILKWKKKKLYVLELGNIFFLQELLEHL